MSDISVEARPVALVIDDDEDTVDLLDLVLTRAGFQVLTATNGPDGLALAREHRPALATIDVTMPQMDGLEVTRRFRESTSTYIVIVSGRSDEQDVIAGFDAGADDYIPKPIRPRELQARLAAVARRPVALVSGGPDAVAWAPAAADQQRGAHLRLVVEGRPVRGAADESPDDEVRDDRDGMIDLGMRFIGSWVEFDGLRINPSRDLLVIDDRLVDVPPECVKLIETMLYAGTHTLTARRLALRYRGETERTATRAAAQDRAWFDLEMPRLLARIGDDPEAPRWFDVRNGRLKLVEPGQARSGP
ncbi:MAG TPA: response regulator [Nocardioides sp.]|nr:response regulator [Nocardioides sp.]